MVLDYQILSVSWAHWNSNMAISGTILSPNNHFQAFKIVYIPRGAPPLQEGRIRLCFWIMMGGCSLSLLTLSLAVMVFPVCILN